MSSDQVQQVWTWKVIVSRCGEHWQVEPEEQMLKSGREPAAVAADTGAALGAVVAAAAEGGHWQQEDIGGPSQKSKNSRRA